MKVTLNKTLVFGIAVFLISITLFSITSFKILPTRVLLSKYQVAAFQYLEDKMDNQRMVDYSPLYFYLNVFARKYFTNPYTFLIWLQILLMAIANTLLFLLLLKILPSKPGDGGRQLEKKNKLIFFIALLGSLLFATNRSILLYTRAFEPEPFVICFLLGFLYFALLSHPGYGNAVSGGDESPGLFLRQAYLPPAIAGLFLGLSLITRSNFFPLVFAMPLFLYLAIKERRKFYQTVIPFLIPILLFSAFLVTRNTMLTGSLTLFSMNPGPVFFEGNNPNSRGESATYPPLVKRYADQFPSQSDYEHFVYRLFSRKVENKELSVSEVNAFWAGKGRNFILDHPFFWLKRVLEKVNFSFHNYRRHDLENVYWNDARLKEKLPALPFALLAAMALTGLFMAAGKWKDYLLIYAAFATQMGVMAVIYASDRQRVVVISLFILFAMTFLYSILTNIKKTATNEEPKSVTGSGAQAGKPKGFGKWKNLLWVLLIIVLFPLLYIETDLMKDEQHQWQRYSLHNKYQRAAHHALKKNNPKKAAENNALACAFAPWLLDEVQLPGLLFKEGFEKKSLRFGMGFGQQDPSSLFDLGYLLLRNGELKSAELLYRQLVEGGYNFNRQYTQSSQPYFYLARIYEIKKDQKTALSFLEKALEKNPGDPWVLAHLFALTSEEVHKKNLNRYFDGINANYILGEAFMDTGKYFEAVKHLAYVVEKLPLFRKGLIYYSIALGNSGVYWKAADYYNRALNLRQGPVCREKEILKIFQLWVEKYPENINAEKFLAVVERGFGR
ncbi:MAG: hypothetical protein GY757_10315 [bacterium]|nr:hypothetical protein [bacterium]